MSNQTSERKKMSGMFSSLGWGAIFDAILNRSSKQFCLANHSLCILQSIVFLASWSKEPHELLAHVMKILTQDAFAIAHYHSRIKLGPWASTTWVNCCRGLLEWDGVGGDNRGIHCEEWCRERRIQCARHASLMEFMSMLVRASAI